MAPTIPTTEPQVLRAGESWRWDVTLSDFPPSDGWSLRYLFHGAGVHSFATTPSGGAYQLRVEPEASADVQPGPYEWIGRVSNEAGLVLFSGRSGRLVVLADFATADASPSHASVMLPLVEAALQAHFTGQFAGVQGLTINGRSVARMDVAELRRLRAQYATELQEEKALAAGGSPFTQIAARFSAPA